jgi:hypothetical protein
MKLSISTLLLAGLSSAGLVLVVSTPLPGRGSGVLPGANGIPANVTKALPGCGLSGCHDTQPNSNGTVRMTFQPLALSVGAGSRVPVTVQALGGPPAGLAGLCVETDKGAFVPGATTKINTAGTAITHANKFATSWTFDWQAPSGPGLVLWTGIGLVANGNGGTSGDSWGFWGPNSATPGVPFRLFVNAPAVSSLGSGCAGKDSHVPVLGASTSAATGTNFVLQLHNAPTGTVALILIGSSSTNWLGLPLPLDLAGVGAPGCFLRTNVLLLLSAVTTGTGSGGGSAITTLAVPQDASLRGAVLYSQELVLDASANAAGLTVTNALAATVQ